MTDLETVRGNVRKMIQQGAPDSEVEAYLEWKGVTPDQLRQSRQPGLGERALGALTRGIRSAGDGMLPGVAPFVRGMGRAAAEGVSPSEGWSRELDVQREQRERYPVSSTLNEIGGGAGLGLMAGAAGATASRFLPQAPNLAQRTAATAVDTGTIGAVQAAGEGRDPSTGAALGMATGAGATLALDPLLRGAGRMLGRRAVADAAPSTDDLRGAANQLYDKADEAGIVFSSDGYNKLAQRINRRLAGEIDDTLHPGAFRTMQRINEKAASGDNPSLRELDFRRRNALGVLMNNASSPDDKRLAGMIVREIDDFIEKAPPREILVNSGNATQAARAIREARQLWRMAGKTDIIEEAMYRAQNQASGFENGLRTQFRSILNSRHLRGKFSETEIEAMERVVQGGKVENFFRLVGKFGFGSGASSNALGGAMGSAAGYGVGGIPGLMGTAMVTGASRGAAESMTRGNARYAQGLIAGGGRMPEATAGTARAVLNSPSGRLMLERVAGTSGVVPISAAVDTLSEEPDR